MDKFHFGAYWKVREETPENGAKLIYDTLVYLKNSGLPSFQSWYELGYSRKEALSKPADISYEYLLKLVLKGKDKKFVDLGYSVSLWNGDNNEESISIGFTIGVTTPLVINNVIFGFPGNQEKAIEFANFERLINISKYIISAWKPDFLRIDSTEMRKLVSNPQIINGYGWINYYSNDFQKGKVIKAPKFDETFEGYGDFLYVTKDLFSSDNPAHIEKLKELVNQFKFKK